MLVAGHSCLISDQQAIHSFVFLDEAAMDL